jgi:aspartokinase-like uncharacterized kinase
MVGVVCLPVRPAGPRPAASIDVRRDLNGDTSKKLAVTAMAAASILLAACQSTPTQESTREYIDQQRHQHEGAREDCR